MTRCPKCNEEEGTIEFIRTGVTLKVTVYGGHEIEKEVDGETIIFETCEDAQMEVVDDGKAISAKCLDCGYEGKPEEFRWEDLKLTDKEE
ncbi:unnamed protein product [marine sediment metagenome]|uniref:Uncharacterized protein n=1 Tax=marine sediment metagenome TaxID=412755 RepID=X1JZU9_9ZZZZ